MKSVKNLILLILFAGVTNNIISQDTLYFLNNSKVVVKIKFTNIFNITYRPLDSTGKHDIVIPKNQVRLVAYANGSFEIFSVKKIKTNTLQNYPMFVKGTEDAAKYYKHHGGEIGTALVSFATGGILGLVPAIMCSSAQPKFLNLDLPKDAPVTSRDYMLGYIYKAKKIKQKKVWGGYGFGVGGAILLAIVTSI